MDIGDVDGDGRNEVVLMEGSDIVVYRFQDQRLLKLATFSSPDRDRFIAVDVADINQNGRAEIFASKVRGTVVDLHGPGVGKRQAPAPDKGLLLVLPGHGLARKGPSPSWPGEDAGKHRRGAGQHLFQRWGPASCLEWVRLCPVRRGPLLDLKDVYIYNFAIGDLTGDGVPEIVMIDKSGQPPPQGPKRRRSSTRRARPMAAPSTPSSPIPKRPKLGVPRRTISSSRPAS